MDLINTYNERLRAKYLAVARTGCRRFDFLGGRRSGKSYLIEQILLGRLLRGEVVNVATMTSEQGRLGVYADVCDIIDGSPSLQPWVEVLKSPRQVNSKANRGRMFFNTYPDPERAKGIACDWLYINEANNFTERQYIDLSASVRRGVFADRNPNSTCWTETNGFGLIHSTWQDNDFLTAEQRAWFETLKEKAQRPDASPVDVALYRMYYLGEYAEIVGTIFSPANFTWYEPADAPRLEYVTAYCDPSSLRNGDYFACVLSGVSANTVYIIDAYSPNTGAWDDIVAKLRQWATNYKDIKLYVETNGFVGGEFYRYAQKAVPLKYYVSTLNKYERILSNYTNLTERVRYADTDAVRDYMKQVYQFAKGCKHDDNADALDATFRLHRYNRHVS